jgi:cell division GTPase FtsZ
MPKKTKEQIEEENARLMEAFAESSSDSHDASMEMDLDVLGKLKGMLDSSADSKEEEEDDMDLVTQRTVSIDFAVVGIGQAGSRLAEVFHSKGYDVGVINTSAQDLEFIKVPAHQKLLLEGSLGGTGKDLDLGRDIFDESEDQIAQFLEPIVDGNNMVYLTLSGGGGTGSSSVDTMVTMMYESGLQVGVIYVLPKATEDAQSKKNSIETLARLAKMSVNKMIVNLVVVDNARIEQIYADLSQSKFWEVSNEAIIEPLHVFNTLTCSPSKFTSLDPSDFTKIIAAGNCSTYGVIEVENYMDETALAEAVIKSLNGNMLASGFDLSQTKAGGVIIVGPESALERLPALNINYCFHMISEQTSGAAIFQGVYAVPSEKDSIKIYSWFAGLGLPKDRVENLKRESEEQAILAEAKEKNSAATMTLDFDDDSVNNTSKEITRKIKRKNSPFAKMQKSGRVSLLDRRKKR